ncbi:MULTISPECIES: ABC-three component system middle component 5 [Flavobacteriaceae]|uniref:ABC-three component system middle component 5 n=1 Tax=Flavobacteriaceae TaxID=49546 RepID=UPI000489E4FA|nr:MULTISPECIES: ABC-three component system middle component 5 [Flavobacteriaceae]
MEKTEEIIEIDKLRILDFYLAFPSELMDIRSFRGFKKYEKYIKAEKNRYERVIDRKRLFFKMEHIQLSAIKALISYGIFDAEEFKKGNIKKSYEKLSESLNSRIHLANEENPNLITLITGPLSSMNLFGHLGLKERTNLIEFKYDSI